MTRPVYKCVGRRVYVVETKPGEGIMDGQGQANPPFTCNICRTCGLFPEDCLQAVPNKKKKRRNICWTLGSWHEVGLPSVMLSEGMRNRAI